MAGMDGLLDFAKTPQGQGLLAAVAGGLTGARRGTPWNNAGRAGLAGLAGYSNAVNMQGTQELRDLQTKKIKEEQEAAKNSQDAIGRISAGRQSDPNFKPSFADLAYIDKGAAIKSVAPDGAIDFGLEPKVGISPTSGKMAYFVQDKRGGTRWLDAAVPPDYQFVAGTDYKAPTVFNRRDGQMGGVNVVQEAGSGVAAPSMPGGYAQPQQAPQIDPLAPWSKLTSPKEQDGMRARVFETDNKRLDELRAQVTQGRAIMKDLDRFGQLNREQGTGGAVDRFDWLPTMDSEKREMEAISSRLAPAARPAGSGTTSDRDLALYLAGLPGIDKTGDVNKNIRLQYQKSFSEAEKRFAFMEKYLTDRGHLSGADAAYQQLIKSQAEPGSKDVPPTNPNGTWQDVNISSAAGQNSRDAERLTILRRELQNESDPSNRAALEREISRSGGEGTSPSAPKQPAQNVFDNMPKAETLKGKTIRDNQTGKLLRSNGMSWVEVK